MPGKDEHCPYYWEMQTKKPKPKEEGED